MALAAIVIATPATAQQKPTNNQTIYDAGGRVITRSTTDTSGQTTIYGSDGRIVGKADRSKR